MVQSAIRSPANMYILEGEVAISFHFHGELNVLVHLKGQMMKLSSTKGT
jgi:hypothetical protein